MSSSAIDRNSQPLNPHIAPIWKAGFVITTVALAVIAGLYANSIDFHLALTFGSLMTASALGAVFCHFKAKKIGHENAWFITIATLITLASLQGALFNQCYGSNELVGPLYGLSAFGFVMTAAAIIDRNLKEKTYQLTRLKCLKSCQDSEFIKENLEGISTKEAQKLIEEGHHNHNLVLAIMEKGLAGNEVFHDAIVYWKDDELAHKLLERGFKEEGNEDWALPFITNQNLRNALIQKRDARIETILVSKDQEFICKELKKMPNWKDSSHFLPEVMKRGSFVLKQTIFDICLKQGRYDGQIILDLLNNGFKPIALNEKVDVKKKFLADVIQLIERSKPDVPEWMQVIAKLKEVYGSGP